MGLFRKLKKKISIKNISPIAKLGSAIKTPVKKVVSTGNVGIKDVVAVSPVGLGASIIKSGTSNITDVVVDKPIIKKDNLAFEDANNSADLFANQTNANTLPSTSTKDDKKSNNTLLYAGIGVGVLVLVGGIVFVMRRK